MPIRTHRVDRFHHHRNNREYRVITAWPDIHFAMPVLAAWLAIRSPAPTRNGPEATTKPTGRDISNSTVRHRHQEATPTHPHLPTRVVPVTHMHLIPKAITTPRRMDIKMPLIDVPAIRTYRSHRCRPSSSSSGRGSHLTTDELPTLLARAMTRWIRMATKGPTAKVMVNMDLQSPREGCAESYQVVASFLLRQTAPLMS